MAKRFKYILSVSVTILLAMAISIAFAVNCYAATENVKMSHYVEGLSNGELIQGAQFRFCPEEIIMSDERMTKAFYETEKIESIYLYKYYVSKDGKGTETTGWNTPSSLSNPSNHKYTNIPVKKDGDKTRLYFVLQFKINGTTFISEDIPYPADNIGDGNTTVNGIKNATYTGKAIKQSLTVKYKGVSLVENLDYTVAYSNNTNAGTAKVTIKGINGYKGTITKQFSIAKAANPIKVTAKGSVTVKYSSLKKSSQTLARSKVMTISNSKGTLSFAKTSGNSSITINKTSGKVTVKKGLGKGTYKVKVKVTAAGNSNYKAGSKTVTITIKVA